MRRFYWGFRRAVGPDVTPDVDARDVSRAHRDADYIVHSGDTRRVMSFDEIYLDHVSQALSGDERDPLSYEDAALALVRACEFGLFKLERIEEPSIPFFKIPSTGKAA